MRSRPLRFAGYTSCQRRIGRIERRERGPGWPVVQVDQLANVSEIGRDDLFVDLEGSLPRRTPPCSLTQFEIN